MADRLIRNDRGATPMEWGLSPAATPLSLRGGDIDRTMGET